MAYMTPTTKDTRRKDWASLNFAGTIDWAVDLQAFTQDDMTLPPNLPREGENGCLYGEDLTVNSENLCGFSCSLGYCPTSLCICTMEGPVIALPPDRFENEYIAWDEFDVDLNRLCKFACKLGYCPELICTTPVIDEDMPLQVGSDDIPNFFDVGAARLENAERCLFFQDPKMQPSVEAQCGQFCKSSQDAAAAEGRSSNCGCIGTDATSDYKTRWTYERELGGNISNGKCFADNMIVTTFAEIFLDALPAIGQVMVSFRCCAVTIADHEQIGCFLIMSTFRSVIDLVGFIPGVGQTIHVALGMSPPALTYVLLLLTGGSKTLYSPPRKLSIGSMMRLRTLRPLSSGGSSHAAARIWSLMT